MMSKEPTSKQELKIRNGITSVIYVLTEIKRLMHQTGTERVQD